MLCKPSPVTLAKEPGSPDQAVAQSGVNASFFVLGTSSFEICDFWISVSCATPHLFNCIFQQQRSFNIKEKGRSS
jgi:hypothetical protein